MQNTLRHEIVRAIFHAQPIDESQLEQPVETELTRAARGSISNANQLSEAGGEFEEADFVSRKSAQAEQKKSADKRKKARKAERQRKTKARTRK
jgi:hypothetical protein